MKLTLWCPSEGRAFAVDRPADEVVIGRRIRCPVCRSVHLAEAPPEMAPIPPLRKARRAAAERRRGTRGLRILVPVLIGSLILAAVLVVSGISESDHAREEEATPADVVTVDAPEEPPTARLEELDRRFEALWNERDFVQAEVVCREALDIRQRTLGADHIDCVPNLRDLAFACCSKRETREEGFTLLRRALSIQRKSLGEEHVEFLRTESQLGALRWAFEGWAGAYSLYQRRLEKTRENCGGDSPECALVHAVFARAYSPAPQTREMASEARAICQRGVEASLGRRRAPGTEESTLECVNTLFKYAEVYARLGMRREADMTGRRALVLVTAELGDDHPAKALCHDRIAEIRETLGDE